MIRYHFRRDLRLLAGSLPIGGRGGHGGVIDDVPDVSVLGSDVVSGPHMGLAVLGQIGGVGEGLTAVFAFMRFFTRVQPFVLFQGPNFSEGFVTIFTGEWFLAFVPSDVGLIGVFVQEGLGTVFALPGFFACKK